MKPLKVKYDISENCPNKGRKIIVKHQNYTNLEYISSLNINEIYAQVTNLEGTWGLIETRVGDHE